MCTARWSQPWYSSHIKIASVHSQKGVPYPILWGFSSAMPAMVLAILFTSAPPKGVHPAYIVLGLYPWFHGISPIMRYTLW